MSDKRKFINMKSAKNILGILENMLSTKEDSIEVIQRNEVDKIWNELNYKVAPVGLLEETWNYSLDTQNKIVYLKNYIGNETDVIVYARYPVDGEVYRTVIKNHIAYNNMNEASAFMFNGCKSTANTKDHTSYRYNIASIKTITFNEGIDTSELTDARFMFQSGYACWWTGSAWLYHSYGNLREINGLQYFDTSNVKAYTGMFMMVKDVEILDLSSFIFDNKCNRANMFFQANNSGTINRLKSVLVKAENIRSVDGSDPFSGCTTVKKFTYV